MAKYNFVIVLTIAYIVTILIPSTNSNHQNSENSLELFDNDLDVSSLITSPPPPPPLLLSTTPSPLLQSELEKQEEKKIDDLHPSSLPPLSSSSPPQPPSPSPPPPPSTPQSLPQFSPTASDQHHHDDDDKDDDHHMKRGEQDENNNNKELSLDHDDIQNNYSDKDDAKSNDKKLKHFLGNLLHVKDLHELSSNYLKEGDNIEEKFKQILPLLLPRLHEHSDQLQHSRNDNDKDDDDDDDNDAVYQQNCPQQECRDVKNETMIVKLCMDFLQNANTCEYLYQLSNDERYLKLTWEITYRIFFERPFGIVLFIVWTIILSILNFLILFLCTLLRPLRSFLLTKIVSDLRRRYYFTNDSSELHVVDSHNNNKNKK